MMFSAISHSSSRQNDCFQASPQAFKQRSGNPPSKRSSQGSSHIAQKASSPLPPSPNIFCHAVVIHPSDDRSKLRFHHQTTFLFDGISAGSCSSCQHTDQIPITAECNIPTPLVFFYPPPPPLPVRYYPSCWSLLCPPPVPVYPQKARRSCSLGFPPPLLPSLRSFDRSHWHPCPSLLPSWVLQFVRRRGGGLCCRGPWCG